MTASEASVEHAALDWLLGFDWTIAHGPDISRDGRTGGLQRSRARLATPKRARPPQPDLPQSALDDAFRKLIRPAGATLGSRARAFHRMLVDGRQAARACFIRRPPGTRDLDGRRFGCIGSCSRVERYQQVPVILQGVVPVVRHRLATRTTPEFPT